ncbi:MAG: hypothetical protein EB168_05115 [Euryarchaeota archaeon]|nr:hypothetical protein [Euryarchaeota archaeon]
MSEDKVVTRTGRRVNYLNNRDILKEIHKSKKTYCAYDQFETDSDFDIIVHDIKKINKARIKEARELKCVSYKKEYGQELDPKSVADTDLVFRLMTWEHIPLVPKKPTKAQLKKRAKLEEMFDDIEEAREEEDYGIDDHVHAKVNFPPFQHYKVDENGTPYKVGQSHWKGSLDNGKFSKDHGQMTSKLAHMFIKLCERYATRSNWRGYTYNEEMRGQALLQLSQIGLQFDESKSDNPFAYYTAAITNSFTRVLNIEKKNQSIRDDILEMNGLNPSWTRQNAELDAKLEEKYNKQAKEQSK